MRLIYSIGAKFAGGGIGTTAYHAVSGLHRHGLLYYLLCGAYCPSEIPSNQIMAMGLPSRILRRAALYDKSRWLNYVHNVLYDKWAVRHVNSCDWFHGWNHHCFHSLQKAKEVGVITSVERASSHPKEHVRLLREEYERWGLTFTIPEITIEQATAEIDLADYTFVPSDFAYSSCLKHGVRAEKLLLIPFGTDIQRFHPIPRPEPNKKFQAVFVGQVGVGKGVPDLLETWKLLNWSDAELWLAGRISADIQNILMEYRNLPGVHFLGHTDPKPLLQQADVFVFPTITEGSALVTYEAMACGLPVLTTQNAGSIVRDGREGYVMPIRDSVGFAQRLEELRSNPQLCQEMGRSARERVEQYTWHHYGERFAERIMQIRTQRRDN